MVSEINKTDLSIVITAFNFEKGIEPLIKEIREHLNEQKPNNFIYEVILVDDASQDSTSLQIQKACENDPFVKGITLFNNVGQQLAMSAGAGIAKGEFVLLMDGDFENPIHQIFPLYKKITSTGSDIVYTVGKVNQSPLRRFSSKFFYWSLKHIFRVQTVPNQLMMRIFTRNYLNFFLEYRERVRTIMGITQHIGGKFDTLTVTREKRKIGKSNYNFAKRLDVYVTAVMSLSAYPLDILFTTGSAVFVLSFIAGCVQVYRKFHYGVQPGFSAIFTAILFFGGLQLMSIGLLARYISFVYTEVKNRPLYQIRKTYNI